MPSSQSDDKRSTDQYFLTFLGKCADGSQQVAG